MDFSVIKIAYSFYALSRNLLIEGIPVRTEKVYFYTYF